MMRLCARFASLCSADLSFFRGARCFSRRARYQGEGLGNEKGCTMTLPRERHGALDSKLER